MRAEYKKLNPLQLVPALEIGGTVLADSIAILFVNLPFPLEGRGEKEILGIYVMGDSDQTSLTSLVVGSL